MSTYVAAQLIAGWLFGGGFVIASPIGVLATALVFAGVSTWFHHVPAEHECAN